MLLFACALVQYSPVSDVRFNVYFAVLQWMQVLQKNLDEVSSRMSAVESVKNSWRPPADEREAKELREELRVCILMHKSRSPFFQTFLANFRYP